MAPSAPSRDPGSALFVFAVIVGVTHRLTADDRIRDASGHGQPARPLNPSRKIRLANTHGALRTLKRHFADATVFHEHPHWRGLLCPAVVPLASSRQIYCDEGVRGGGSNGAWRRRRTRRQIRRGAAAGHGVADLEGRRGRAHGAADRRGAAAELLVPMVWRTASAQRLVQAAMSNIICATSRSTTARSRHYPRNLEKSRRERSWRRGRGWRRIADPGRQ